MRVAFRLCEAHIHKPLIRFIGKRTPQTKPHTPHPHPAAPPEVASHFSDFLKRFNSSSHSPSASRNTSSTTGSTANSQVYHEYWEAPSRFWARSRQINEIEIEAILSGGASVR